MSKWAVIWLLVHRPLFDFSRTIVGPFDFLQYLFRVPILFALCALLRQLAAGETCLSSVLLAGLGRSFCHSLLCLGAAAHWA
jgi:hypothetical protein